MAWDREVQEEAKEQDDGREEDELAEKRWLVQPMQAAGNNWRYGGGERIQLEKQAVDAETGAETGAAEDPIRQFNFRQNTTGITVIQAFGRKILSRS